jgi:hypothetical protein
MSSERICAIVKLKRSVRQTHWALLLAIDGAALFAPIMLLQEPEMIATKRYSPVLDELLQEVREREGGGIQKWAKNCIAAATSNALLHLPRSTEGRSESQRSPRIRSQTLTWV